MIRRIIAFSARNRALVLLFVAALIAFAGWVLHEIRLDALPDLSDTQVIVYSRWDRSPDIVEDQVTYPIISALLGAPRSRRSAVSPTSASPTSTSSSRTAPTSTGPARGCSNTCRR